MIRAYDIIMPKSFMAYKTNHQMLANLLKTHQREK